ncbi:guanine nucleotide exchange factor subunit Rich [Tachypleus tridentatus]|uniref:guanine nucleotide exchange factor subunit Rich n=1 Tax=Tachypleus tridentatus TaxID=6853 RepID=UPI003FCF5BDF
MCHRYSQQSISTLGTNMFAAWRPDSSTLAVATSNSHLVFFYLEMDEYTKGLYEQNDSKVSSLKRESAELFIKETILPLEFSQNFSTHLPGGITSLLCIREELMATTTSGWIWRLKWDGTINRDYCIDVRNVPFAVDQQLSRGITLGETNVYVKDLEYSPLIGGFSVVLSDGRAGCLTAPSFQFYPEEITGIWAQEIRNATCTAVNHRYRLIAFGLENGEGVVYCQEDLTGALHINHRLVLSTRDFSDVAGVAGAVSLIQWSPDGTAVAMAWKKGGLSVWSVFGALLMCSLGWDYGSVDAMRKTPFRINSMEWGAEGYHLWMIMNSVQQQSREQIMKDKREEKTTIVVLPFVKSALTVNAGMTGRGHVFLQGEDRLLISTGADLLHHSADVKPKLLGHRMSFETPLWGSKQWVVVSISSTYLAANWPIRYSAIDSSGCNIAVAGKMGMAHYSLDSKKWKLFGNESQEQDFVVMGGLLWWHNHIVLGCFNLRDTRDEIRIYPQGTKLDNHFVRVAKVPTQVLQLSALGDHLLAFLADSHLTMYQLKEKDGPTSNSLHIAKIVEVDLSNLVVHPACVVSALLTSLRTESVIWSGKSGENVLLNICGRLLLLQQDPAQKTVDTINNNEAKPVYSVPLVLASCVENVWVSPHKSPHAPHLTEALWIACGAQGMRVWLPLFPHDEETSRSHNFMSKRIMLPVQVQIYPLAVLFEDAVVLGAENDTVPYSARYTNGLPLCVISRSSQVYLHHILRQLLRRNLGYHAWEIARRCSNLPYFPHTQELLLHEVLEEEATSSEPIPDALLPRVIEFIREFPVFLQTVVQCARKTELALWPHLFAAVGNPKDLFQECLRHGQFETAASYLIILQNLEVVAVSRQHATLLLDGALDGGKWELSKELVRFLRAIAPSDVESPPRTSLSIVPSTKYSFPHHTPPVSPTAEDLSLVLGTLPVGRSRAYSNVSASKMSRAPTHEAANIGYHKDVSHSHSDPQLIPPKRISSVAKDTGSAEDFFIDAILNRHARKLLLAGHLCELGYFAAYLDFQLISFLRKERLRAAKVEDFVSSLKLLHHEFQWPFPFIHSTLLTNNLRKNSVNSGLENNLTPLPTMYLPQSNTNSIPSPDCIDGPPSKPQSLLPVSSQDIPASSSGCDTTGSPTIEAVLLPQSAKDTESLLTQDTSESGSMWGEESFSTFEDDGYASLSMTTDLETITQELASRGSQQSEVQLRYLLQVMLEAGCLDWSLLISILLRDAMAIARVVNAVKQPELSQGVAQQLLDGLGSLQHWIETECVGYKPFMLAIRNQIKALTKQANQKPQVLKLHSPIGQELQDSWVIEEEDSVSSSSVTTPYSEQTNKKITVSKEEKQETSVIKDLTCKSNDLVQEPKIAEGRKNECAIS